MNKFKQLPIIQRALIIANVVTWFGVAVIFLGGCADDAPQRTMSVVQSEVGK